MDVKRVDGRHPRTLYQLAMGDCLSCGTEDIDAASEVPWHAHEAAEEVLFCTAGSGSEGSAALALGGTFLTPCSPQDMYNRPLHRFPVGSWGNKGAADTPNSEIPP